MQTIETTLASNPKMVFLGAALLLLAFYWSGTRAVMLIKKMKFENPLVGILMRLGIGVLGILVMTFSLVAMWSSGTELKTKHSRQIEKQNIKTVSKTTAQTGVYTIRGNRQVTRFSIGR